jgi:hypothetical protein
MRIVILALVFWLVVSGPSRAGYVWLGPWQVDGGTAGSSLSGAAVGVTWPSAQGGSISSIAFSRQF